MATQASGSDFTSNLGRVYAMYTGGFAAFVIFLAVLEQAGVPDRVIGYLFLFFTIGVYAMIGIMSRTMQVSEYYVAGRAVPALYNGMATAADWMSAASFIAMAGILYNLGYDGLAFILGWTGGYVLVATLVAPYLRKFGAYTVPDFFSARYGGKLASGCAIIVLMATSFTYVTAQLVGTGQIASRFLEMDFTYAVFVGLVGILVCSMLGGMRAVTWTQVAQYIVLIIAYILPVAVLSAQKFGVPVPQVMYGQVLAEIEKLESQFRAAGLMPATMPSYVQPFSFPGAPGGYDMLNFFGLLVCLMIGTASLPHVLMRYFTTPSVREARQSVGWSIFFIYLLYFTAPAYAAFAKYEVFTTVIGKAPEALAGLSWIFTYGKLKLVQICGVDATTVEAIKAACSNIQGHAGLIRVQDIRLHNDVVVLATPEIAGLPYVIAGLVAAGGLAAALSTADGLLLAIANALSHDVYYKMINPNAPTARRLTISRILLVVVAIASAYWAMQRPADIGTLVAWAFSMAAAGFFPALVLGVWWKRCNAYGAIAGLVAGFALCIYYMFGTRYYAVGFYETWSFLSNASQANIDRFAQLKAAWVAAAEGPAKVAAWTALDSHAQRIANWWGIRNIASGMIGLPVTFIVTIVVTLMTPAPSRQVMEMIDEIRKPKGGTMSQDKVAAAELAH